MARIEREAQEKAAKAEAEGKKEEPLTALQQGEGDALNNYAKMWQTKLDLHGAEAVRTQVAESEGQPNAKAAIKKAQEAADAVRSRQPLQSRHVGNSEVRPREEPLRFDPPARGRNDDSSGRRQNTQQVSVADFRVPQSDRNDADADLFDRQFSVLGDEMYSGTGISAAQVGPPSGPFCGSGAGSAAAGEPEAMPIVWQQMAAANKEAELQAIEQNFARRESGQGGPDAAAGCHVLGKNELEALD